MLWLELLQLGCAKVRGYLPLGKFPITLERCGGAAIAESSRITYSPPGRPWRISWSAARSFLRSSRPAYDPQPVEC
jgi:hypothetical protein